MTVYLSQALRMVYVKMYQMELMMPCMILEQIVMIVEVEEIIHLIHVEHVAII